MATEGAQHILQIGLSSANNPLIYQNSDVLRYSTLPLGEIPWIYKPEQESTCKYSANLNCASLEYASHLTVWMGDSKTGIHISHW